MTFLVALINQRRTRDQRKAHREGTHPFWVSLLLFWLIVLGVPPLRAEAPFHLPTANRALFEKGGEERFFAPTPGRPWTSGMFGCVRTEGWQMHEGLDIRSVQHDKHGEPTDPVMATADGMVVYINHRAGLSTYGKYIMLRHVMAGLDTYSLYAHLSEVRADLRPGVRVRAGERIGIMGRTSNTRQRIGKDRAHVHFELGFLVNDRFPVWFKKNRPGERNDHGAYNGQNFVGLDPRRVFLEEEALGRNFSLRRFLLGETELFRVRVRATGFTWLQRCPALIMPNAKLGNQPVAGYELVLDYNGLPFQVIPCPASEFKGKSKFQLLSVNAAEVRASPLPPIRGPPWQKLGTDQPWTKMAGSTHLQVTCPPVEWVQFVGSALLSSRETMWRGSSTFT